MALPMTTPALACASLEPTPTVFELTDAAWDQGVAAFTTWYTNTVTTLATHRDAACEAGMRQFERDEHAKLFRHLFHMGFDYALRQVIAGAKHPVISNIHGTVLFVAPDSPLVGHCKSIRSAA